MVRAQSWGATITPAVVDQIIGRTDGVPLFIEEFAKLLRNYYSRHYVKPGITGLAQRKVFRGEISEVSLLEKRVGYDLMYINKWSLLLDIKILFATARQILFPPKTAY